jgi:hypothetical protein
VSKQKANAEIVYWSADKHCEYLTCEAMNEAVEYYLDGLGTAEWPEVIEVYGYSRIAPAIEEHYSLCPLVERLDEEFGSPDDSSDWTDAMLKAEAEFHQVVLEEYESWACEVVKTVRLDTRIWLGEHRPDWISAMPPKVQS